MEQAGVAGLKPDEVWNLTLREIQSYCKGQMADELARWQRAVWAAFQGERFHRMKRLSPEALKRTMRGLDRRPKKPLTPEQWKARLQMWTLAFSNPRTESR